MSDIWTTATTENSCLACELYLFNHGLFHFFFEYTVRFSTSGTRYASINYLTTVESRTDKQEYDSNGELKKEVGERIIQKPEGYNGIPMEFYRSGVFLSITRASDELPFCSPRDQSMFFGGCDDYVTYEDTSSGSRYLLDEAIWMKDFTFEFDCVSTCMGKWRLTIPSGLKSTLKTYPIEIPLGFFQSATRHIYEYIFPYDPHTMLERL